MSTTGDAMRQAGRAMDAQEATEASLGTQMSRGAPVGPAQSLAALAQSQIALMSAAKAAVQTSGEQSSAAIQAMAAEVVSMGAALLELGQRPVSIEYDEEGRISNVRRG